MARADENEMSLPTQVGSIPARDGYPLAVEIVRATNSEGNSRIVVMNAAMGVPRQFYRKFALALAEKGMTTVLWDYRMALRRIAPGTNRAV